MLFQVIGSALVLAAFCAVALRRTQPDSIPYLLANVVGASLLAVDAYHLRQWGFLALEATWAIVSGWSLCRTVLPRRMVRSFPWAQRRDHSTTRSPGLDDPTR